MGPLYEALLGLIIEKWPDTAVEIKKTQTSFRAGYIFGCVSAAGKGRLRLTFSLPYRLEHPRIAQSTEPYPMRWTHHTIISDEAQIDDEVMTWLAEAREFAMNK